MKRVLLIIGDDLKNNPDLISYIFNEYSKKFGSLDDVRFINKDDKHFFNKIETLNQEYSYITIFTSQKNSTLIARFLATICNDLIKLYENGFMALSNAKKISQDSYITKLDETLINVVKAEPMKKLGEIGLKKCSSSISFYIFQPNEDKLSSLLKNANLKFTITKTSKYLIFIKIYNVKTSSQLTKTLKTFKNQIIFESSIYEFVYKKLKDLKAKISFAESCTVGLIASNFGSIDGISEVFSGSVVSYSNEIKNSWLGVTKDTFKKYSEVSKECVSKMLDGSLEVSGASFALAVSGYAGASPNPQIKSGTVFIGAAQRNGGKIIEKFEFEGDRNYIRQQCATSAFCLLILLRKDLFLN